MPLPPPPPTAASTGTVPSAGRRPRATASDFGGSLEQVLASDRRPSARSSAELEPATTQRVAHRVRTDGASAAFGGSLEEVFVPRAPAPRIAPPPARLPEGEDLWVEAGRPDVTGAMGQARAAAERPAYHAPLPAPAFGNEASVDEHGHADASIQEPVGALEEASNAEASISQLVRMGFSSHEARHAVSRHLTVGDAVAALVDRRRARTEDGARDTPNGRAPAVSYAEEWGGGLADVLRRREAPPTRGPASAEYETVPRRTPHASEARRRAGAAADNPLAAAEQTASLGYEELMALHVRDNVARPVGKHADDWRAVLRKLRTVRAPTSRARAIDDARGEAEGATEEACCSVCLEALHGAAGSAVHARHAVCELPCKHTFHRHCIMQCLKRGHWACPNCRYDLRRDAPAGMLAEAPH